jgi:hypothetical protein
LADLQHLLDRLADGPVTLDELPESAELRSVLSNLIMDGIVQTIDVVGTPYYEMWPHLCWSCGHFPGEN